MVYVDLSQELHKIDSLGTNISCSTLYIVSQQAFNKNSDNLFRQYERNFGKSTYKLIPRNFSMKKNISRK